MSHHEGARPYTALGRVPVRAGRRVQPTIRRVWPWVWGLAAVVVVVAAARAAAAASDVRAVFAHVGGLHVSWLGVVVAAEIASLAGGVAAQRLLLSVGGVSLRWRTVFGVVFASTGLARVMPAGPVTGGAWQVGEYQRRGAGAGVGVWAVLAGGFTSVVATLGLLLA